MNLNKAHVLKKPCVQNREVKRTSHLLHGPEYENSICRKGKTIVRKEKIL